MKDPTDSLVDEAENSDDDATEAETIFDGMTVSLGSRTVELHVPDSTAACFDLLELSQRSTRRAVAAALVLCGTLQPSKPGGKSKPLARLLKLSPDLYDFRWAAFGGAAYDALLKMKAPRGQILLGGTNALLLIADHCKALDGAHGEPGN